MNNFINKIIPKRSASGRYSVVSVQNELKNSTPELPGETIEDRCRTLAYMIGLDQPVPERVLVVAMENTGYMRRLLASQDNVSALYDLLNNPPVLNGKSEFTGTALVAKAGKALMKWALSGFPTVSKEVLKKREDACLSCPNLTEATHSVQRFSASSQVSDRTGWRTGSRSCASCGCVVHNKIRLATESCPEHISGNVNMNRWGEPLVSAK